MSTAERVVDTVESVTGTTTKVEYALYRKRLSGGFFLEAVGDAEAIRKELGFLMNEDHGLGESRAKVLARYRLVRQNVTTEATEVALTGLLT